jgi:hypothetical protein
MHYVRKSIFYANTSFFKKIVMALGAPQRKDGFLPRTHLIFAGFAVLCLTAIYIYKDN